MQRLLICFLMASSLFGQRPSAEAVEAWQARKFGMFIHFGLYSMPGGVWKGQPVRSGYSEQIQGEGKIGREEYAKLAGEFRPERWDPEAVARLAKMAGMKYIVLTSKHHDGFNLFGTKQSRFNVVEATPYGKDIVAGLAKACAKEGLKFGVYYSTIDWHDERATPSDGGRNDNEIPKAHEEFNVAQIRELMSGYGPLTEIWFDMGKPTPEQSKRFAGAVHELQPDCMVSGRVFNHQGDFTVMGDNQIPDYVIDEPWQTPASIYHETWGYRSWQKREDLNGKIREHIIKLVEVASRGGNYLLNIGPRGDGSIVEFEQEVLAGIGTWMKQNGEALYGAKAQPFRQLEFGQAAVKPGKLYLFVRNWPADGRLRLPGLKTKLKGAYYLAQPGERLEVEAGAVVLTKRVETAPVTVVVAEYDGALEVTPRLSGVSGPGGIELAASGADKFYNYNGRGYYEPRSLYKLKWDFAAPAGRYAVEGVPEGAELELDGRRVTAPLQLGAAEFHTLAIVPPGRFQKGDRLSKAPERVKLVRQ